MKALLLCLSVFALLSCNKDEIVTIDNFKSVEIVPIEIGKGNLPGNGSGSFSGANLVITNDADWQNLITQMDTHGNISDTFSETNIDFNTHIIIAVIMDLQASGAEVNISGIIENKCNITVCVEQKLLDTAVDSQPFHIVKIPITNKSVLFQ